MQINVTVNMDNDAFYDEWNGAPELERVFRRITEAVGSGDREGTCRDTNGNKVGAWHIVDYEKCTIPED